MHDANRDHEDTAAVDLAKSTFTEVDKLPPGKARSDWRAELREGRVSGEGVNEVCKVALFTLGEPLIRPVRGSVQDPERLRASAAPPSRPADSRVGQGGGGNVTALPDTRTLGRARRLNGGAGGIALPRGVLGQDPPHLLGHRGVVVPGALSVACEEAFGQTRRDPGTAARLRAPQSRSSRPAQHRHHVLGTHLLDLAGQLPRLRLAQAVLLTGEGTGHGSPYSRRQAARQTMAWMIRRPRPRSIQPISSRLAWLS